MAAALISHDGIYQNGVYTPHQILSFGERRGSFSIGMLFISHEKIIFFSDEREIACIEIIGLKIKTMKPNIFAKKNIIFGTQKVAKI